MKQVTLPGKHQFVSKCFLGVNYFICERAILSPLLVCWVKWCSTDILHCPIRQYNLFYLFILYSVNLLFFFLSSLPFFFWLLGITNSLQSIYSWPHKLQYSLRTYTKVQGILQKHNVTNKAGSSQAQREHRFKKVCVTLVIPRVFLKGTLRKRLN